MNKEPDKNNLIFDTFIQAKNALKDYPGGSLVRLDSNDGFYIKLPNNKAAIKPQPYKKIDIAPRIHKNIDIEPKLPEYEGKKDVNNLLYSKNELKNLDSYDNLIIKPCKDCGLKIPKARTEASPMANRCAPCQLKFQKNNSSGLSCINCRKKIPIARIEALPNATRCAPCQEKYELGHPGSITRKVAENPIGSREDFKSMSNKQFGTNIKSKF